MQSGIWARYPFFSRFSAWIVLPLGISAAIAGAVLSSRLPHTSGELKVMGLGGTVTISTGGQSIPVIDATTDSDAYFALGFLHAQNRPWQMELGRRAGAGRLSEVLGESMLHADTTARRLALYENARRIWGTLGIDSRRILMAYVAGVNAGLNDLRVLPLEFYLSNFRPEPWAPEDSLAILQLMAWQLSGNADAEVRRLQMVRNYGAGAANDLLPDVPADLVDMFGVKLGAGTGNGLPAATDGGRTVDSIDPGEGGWVVAGTIRRAARLSWPTPTTGIPLFPGAGMWLL